jgi:hypothetical protein
MKKKITELTEPQKKKMPEYVQKWIAKATTTVNVSDERAIDIVINFRKLIDLNLDVPMIYGENPIECWVLCCLNEHGVAVENLNEEMIGVFNGNPKKWDIPSACLPFNDISLTSTFAFYDFMINEVKAPIEEELLEKYNRWVATSDLFAIYPLSNLTVACKRPLEIHMNENNVLHRDGGPAIVFAGEGDFKVYSLNGVTVPEYLAVTPSHELEIKKYLEESNADVKAEFVRKAGVERFLELGKLVDSYSNPKYKGKDYEWWRKSEYELWDMSKLFSSLDYAPYLKMLNPTTKVWHMEGVSPACRTLKDAIKERFGGRDMKIIAAA